MTLFYQWLFSIIIRPERNTPPTARDLSEDALQHQEKSFGVHLVALSLTKMGDALADIKLILPWLLTALGAPPVYIGWLVPIRESLALLPQLLLAHWISNRRVRKYLWCIGSLIQGLAILGMAVIAFYLEGRTAGIGIIGLLVVFSLARCLCSIVIKDVQGKTIDKQLRGRVSGFATTFAGFATILFACALLFKWIESSNVFALQILLGVAGIAWLISSIIYLSVPELADSPSQQTKHNTLAIFLKLLSDKTLLHFLATRSVLISTALVAPFYVVLASNHSEGNLNALGTLLLLAGLAKLTSGGIWGILSDVSSKNVLMIAGIICGGLALLVNAVIYFEWAIKESYLWYAVVIFILYTGHAGIRIGRTTYLVDMANAKNRAQLVALSNTIIGVILLSSGSLLALVSDLPIETVILGLGVLSLAGAILAAFLPEVTGDQPSTPYSTTSS